MADDLEGVTEEQEAVAAGLRQHAWLASEFFKACRLAGLPDDIARELVLDWNERQWEETDAEVE